jgi:diadenosine tetraphosphate (Ap4A) HIT family hydrolase
VFEDELVIAFNEINPKAAVHFVITPKKGNPD